MADSEYAVAAEGLADRLRRLPRRDAIALACRGSADPAGLAWLAEGLELAAGQLVVDLGGGTGGPAAWLQDRYGCRVVVVDPVEEAARVAAGVFGVPVVVADGARAPLAARADAVVAFAVLSVTDEPARLLAEARRLAPRLGTLEWCARDDEPVEVGGSRFPPVDALRDALAGAGWTVVTGPEEPSLPKPPSWRRATTPAATDEEQDVRDVIADDAIHPVLAVCRAVPG